MSLVRSEPSYSFSVGSFNLDKFQEFINKIKPLIEINEETEQIAIL